MGFVEVHIGSEQSKHFPFPESEADPDREKGFKAVPGYGPEEGAALFRREESRLERILCARWFY